MFKPNDNVKFEWEGETVIGTVVQIVPDADCPVVVSIHRDTKYWSAGELAQFTEDGRYDYILPRILKLENPVTLESITTPFTIVDLNGSRMCLIGGQWMFSSGEVMDAGVYEVLKEDVVTIVFSPESH